MRVRSAAVVLGMSALVVTALTALVRCNLPPLPPGPQALPTRVGLVGGAVLALPAAPVDHAALIATLQGLDFNTVIIESVSDETGAYVADRVALGIELQAALQGNVFIGTYKSTAQSGKPVAALLGTDPTFAECYPGGPTLGSSDTILDKLATCSKDASDQVAAALHAANATTQVGCYITHQPPLVDQLDPASAAAFSAFLATAAGACARDGRFVGISSLLAPGIIDPTNAGVFFRDEIGDSGVNVLMLQDGVGTFDAGPTRAVAYYNGLRNGLEDRVPQVIVWANVEAFACADTTCVTTHPAPSTRYFDQLCAARARVDGIVSTEYFADLAGQPLYDAGDASVGSDAGDAGDGGDAGDAGFDDVDASAQLRNAYLQWVDSGAPCP